MKNNNLPIYLSIAVVFGMLLGIFFNGGDNLSMSKNSTSEKKLKRLMNFIERDYVDDVNPNDLLDGAIAEMLTKLDPHSVYISKEQMQAVKENMEGNFVGIGVQFRVINDSITVIKPIVGGPSLKAGIKAGDRILLANKDTLYNKNIKSDFIFKSLKGELGSKVDLKVYRKTSDSLFNVVVTRDRINIKSVDISYMLNENTGYIKLDRFAKNSYTEFKSSLDKLLSKGMNNLIFDLRGNSGGYIHIANQICDEFLEEGKLIVFTKGNRGQRQDYFAKKTGVFEDGKLYVLIDEKSASASEIVAGALQDNDKGTIIGRRSFGKGLVQEEKDLGDGSVVRLTTARYYTPTKRSIQKPYKLLEKNNNRKYLEEVYSRDAELYNKDSIKCIDSLMYKTPKGKIVYGGGGIIPDVFVPLDSTKFAPPMYYKFLNDFVFDYVDNNREVLSKVTYKEFSSSYNFDEVFKLFEKECNKKYKFTIKPKSKKILYYYLKIILARELCGDEGWYKTQHHEDIMIQKVMELIRK